MERTLILAKPDAVHRGLIGELITRTEALGLTLSGIKLMSLSDELLAKHYAHLIDKPFFEDIVSFMQSSPVVAMVWTGMDAVRKVRGIAGVTDSTQAARGTIRGDLGINVQYNLIHASDSVEAAEAEVNRFFTEDEIFSYERDPNRFPRD